jgi:1,4-dihydroxy-2-naphthoate polyprenyltransferase
MKLKYYIESFRLRTLPLSIAGILLGSFYAVSAGFYRFDVFSLALLTTLSLQILSNIANELGDLEKGADNEQRLGPIRSVQRGALSVRTLQTVMLLFVLLAVISGTALIWTAFGALLSAPGAGMLILGVLAIVASIKYTLGKKAYGYIGLGDVFVFIFFGLVSTLGVYFLSTGRAPLMLLLPASAIGFLSAGVLNVNNLRDMKNDAACRKCTVAVRLGEKKTKLYHCFLITGAFALMAAYAFLQKKGLTGFLFVLSLPIFYFHLLKIIKYKDRDLDGQLKVLSLSTLLFSLLSGIAALF